MSLWATADTAMKSTQIRAIEKHTAENKPQRSLLICSACGGPLNYHFYGSATLAFCQDADESVLNFVGHSLRYADIDSWVLVKCTDELE